MVKTTGDGISPGGGVEVSRAWDQQERVFEWTFSGILFADNYFVRRYVVNNTINIISFSMAHSPVPTNKKDTGKRTDRRPAWDRNSVFSAALSGCVRSARLGFVFSWTRTASGS